MKKILGGVLAVFAALILMAPGPMPGGWGLGGNPLTRAPFWAWRAPTFEFAPPSGGGLKSAQNLCDVLTSDDKVGTWECFNGDGTSTSWDGGTNTWAQWPDAGVVDSQTMALCPNGPNCSSVTRQRHEANEGHATDTAYASGTGSVTACWLGTVDDYSTGLTFITHAAATGAANFAISAAADSAGTAHCFASNGSVYSATATGPALRTEGLVCCKWSPSATVMCVNGTCSATTANPPTINNITGKPTIKGSNAANGDTGSLRTRGAFITRTALSNARIAEIARAVLADTPTGTKGETLTYTRASVSSICPDADCSSVTILPSGRPGIAQGGLQVYRSGTNRLLRSEEIDNASWSKNGLGGAAAPIVTANYCVAPDGSLTADRVEVAACPTDLEASTITQDTGAGAGTMSEYVWVKSNSGTPSVSLCKYAGPGAGNCQQHALTTTWKRIKYEGWAAGAVNNLIALGCENRSSTYTGDTNTGAADLCVWGTQLENSPYATPYIRTTSASATRNASTAVFTGTWPKQPGSLSCEYVGDHGTTRSGSGASYCSVYSGASNETTAYSVTASGQTLQCAGDAVAYGPGTLDGTDKVACQNNAGALTACVSGNCSASASTTDTASGGSIYIGQSATASYEADGIIKSVCVDDEYRRCPGRSELEVVPYFAFFDPERYANPDGGADIEPYAGIPSAYNLCDVALDGGDLIGTWECFNGDGTSTSWDGGSGPWGAIGSVDSQTMQLCPNGTNCSNVTRQRHEANEGHAGDTSYASGTGSVTACWLGTIDDTAAGVSLFTHSTGGVTAQMSWFLQWESGGTGGVVMYISDGAALASAQSAAATLRAEHLLCGKWSAANGIKACIDGTCSAATAKASRQSLTTKPTIHGVGGASAVAVPVRTRGSFVTYGELSDARIAAIARAVLADTPTGAKGETMTFTRATASSVCPDANCSSVTILPPGRPAIAQNGLHVYRSSTNVVLRSEELDNASWYTTGGAAVTANSTVAPDGSKTAERVQVAACPAGAQSMVYQGISGPGLTNGTFSIWLKGNASTPTVTLCWGIVVSGACEQKTLTTAWKRYSISGLTSAPNTTVTVGCNDDATYTGNADTGAADFFAWGAQVENLPYATPYVRTTSATVTRNAESATFPLVMASHPSSLSARLIREPIATATYLVTLRNSATSYISLQTNASEEAYCMYGVGGGYDTDTKGTFTGDNSAACRVTSSEVEAYMDRAGSGTPASHARGPFTSNQIQVGCFTDYAGYIVDGIVSSVCVDPSLGRCR